MKISSLRHIFGLDLRSLALFRVAMGMLIIVDLIIRSTDLTAHYTDMGVMPRSLLAGSTHLISLHLINGTWQFQGILFIIAGLFAFGMTIGYRTRLCTIASWFFLISIYERNYMIIQGSDALMKVVLFWCMFLPWGEVYSVDSLGKSSEDRNPDNKVLTAGTLGYAFQIGFVYFFAAAVKYGSDWQNGSAVYYALSIDQLTRPIGQLLLGLPDLTRFLTLSARWLEGVGPFLWFSPVFTWQLRMISLVALAIMQLGFGLSMRLGPFPWAAVIVTLGLLPSEFWNYVLSEVRLKFKKKIKIYYDGECAFCERLSKLVRIFFLLPETPLLEAQSDRSINNDMKKYNSWVVVDAKGNRHYKYKAFLVVVNASMILRPFKWIFKIFDIIPIGRYLYECVASNRMIFSQLVPEIPVTKKNPEYQWEITKIFVGSVLIYTFFWNLSNIPHFNYQLPGHTRWVAGVLRIDQMWDMFAPTPLKEDGWWVIVGNTKSKKQVDIFRDGAVVNWEKPSLGSSLFKSVRWGKYYLNLWSINHRSNASYLSTYLCREWNNKNKRKDSLDNLQIYFMREDTLPPGQGEAEPLKVELWNQNCN
ncbi:MAG: HTTM domain-containing protein [Oligoflexia bacterium]|nr:HTTM domain-containing protein [Oligoflexia bacterium]